MGNRKMCIRYKKGQFCPAVDTQFCRRSGTNDKCQIITHKKKMVKIKALAYIDWDSGCYMITAVNIKPKYFSGAYTVPCAITIDAKWLKGEE